AGLRRIRLVLTLQVLDEGFVLAHVEPIVEVGQSLVEAILLFVRHAARDGDRSAGARPFPGLELPKPAVGLLLGILADGAGDKDRKVSLVEVGHGAEAGRRQALREVIGIRLVHLATAHPEVKPLARRWPLVAVGAWPRESVRFEG